MLFGKAFSSQHEQEDPEQLGQVSLEFDSDTLRDISRFLMHCADLIDREAFRHTHMHIDEFVKGWTKRHPDSDIVVLFGVDESALGLDG